MRLQDHLVRCTQKALDDVCRAALAVPADHREWSVGGVSRSTLSQMQEIAVSAEAFLEILAGGPEVDAFAVIGSATGRGKGIATLEECVERARTSTVELCRRIAETTDRELEREISMPFGGGMRVSLAEFLGLHHWNLVYHLGQINQIQLALGDNVMH